MDEYYREKHIQEDLFHEQSMKEEKETNQKRVAESVIHAPGLRCVHRLRACVIGNAVNHAFS